MSSRPFLEIATCSREAAEYAHRHWHYAPKMPAGKNVYFGVWEAERFIGAVIYGGGTSPQAHHFLNLERLEVCELVRVALTKHVSPVTRIVAITLRELRRRNPGLKAVVSFADTEQGHIGGIYQGGNWVYVGASAHNFYVIRGEKMHSRNVHGRYINVRGDMLAHIQRYVDPNAKRLPTLPKHKYVMALDSETKAKLELLRRPYPKRAASIDSDATAFQADEGGANPTAALHSTDETCFA